MRLVGRRRLEYHPSVRDVKSESRKIPACVDARRHDRRRPAACAAACACPATSRSAHRYALLAALADGTSRLTNFSPGADCRSTLACLRGLGVDVDDGPDGTVTLMGRGLGRLRSPAGPLDAGNSGTTMRLLAGVLAGHRFAATLIGDASLSRRPMRRVIDAARAHGRAGSRPSTVIRR